MRIEIICTGDEVLTGKINNTNFSHVAQRLEDVGLDLQYGLVVGDDPAELKQAFNAASLRADAVIVNGGLGPTIDDLSQEVAAEVAGVPLELHEGWLEWMKAFFAGRGRVMPDNNRKQAMLPKGSEMLDNPIGTACGFALPINQATFYFTPGVPRELYRMLEEQILPRLLKQQGTRAVIRLKRFHSYGLGESHVDQLLQGIEQFAPANTVKLGFRAHYPQLETKITIRGENEDAIATYLAPVQAEVRKRLSHFILAEDEQTLEGQVNHALQQQGMQLGIAEQVSGGLLSSRLISVKNDLTTTDTVKWALTAPSVALLQKGIGLEEKQVDDDDPQSIEVLLKQMAHAVQQRQNVECVLVASLFLKPSHESKKTKNNHGNGYFGVLKKQQWHFRHCDLRGTTHWIRLGMVEMGLDVLRRCLYGLPIDEKTDFELAASPKKPA